MTARRRIPLWLKLGYGVATPAIALAYARTYGPQNFLWLSDVALGLTAVAAVAESPLAASLAAVGALPLELAWNLDFLAGGKPFGLAGYMFDAKLPRFLRALSLFHVALPPSLILLLRRLGYDRRAFPMQAALTALLLPASRKASNPRENVNWAFGPGERPQRRISPGLYLGLEILAFVLLAHLPTHLALRRLFPAAPRPGRRA
ncbi:MAG TPA: hypothetical protein VE993_10590 [Stellaceae bacterium]|nr:hypothetical protein [Stellaceae bacterium]